jgi:hypothetical protein
MDDVERRFTVSRDDHSLQAVLPPHEISSSLGVNSPREGLFVANGIALLSVLKETVLVLLAAVGTVGLELGDGTLKGGEALRGAVANGHGVVNKLGAGDFFLSERKKKKK